MKLTSRKKISIKYNISYQDLNYMFQSGKLADHPQPVKRHGKIFYYDEEESSKFLDQFFDDIDLPKPKIKVKENFEYSGDMKLMLMFYQSGVRYRMEYLEK